MLSGEGNENGDNTTIGLISQKATLQVQHTNLIPALKTHCRQMHLCLGIQESIHLLFH